MRIFVLLFPVLLISCGNLKKDHNSSIEILPEFSDLQNIINKEKDRLMIVNFWATSCPPCLKEMPHFRKLEEEYGTKLKVLLVSLDKIDVLDSRVYPFVKKYNIAPEVAVLADPGYNVWTGMVDSTWYGALPATLMLKGENRHFRFGIYESYEELQIDVDSMLN